MNAEQNKNTSFICPHCSSENIQSFPMAYKTGVTNVSTTTTGAGFDIGLPAGSGIGIGHAATKGVNKSLLAQQLSPPQKQTYFFSAFLYWIITNIILSTVSSLITPLSTTFIDMPHGINPFITAIYFLFYFCFPVYIAIRCTKSERLYNKYEYPKQLHQWYHSYVCLKCGTTFVRLDENRQDRHIY